MEPSGRRLASANGGSAVRLWELPTGRLLKTLQEHDHAVSSLALDRRGRLLASGSFDRTIKLWELSSGRLLKTLDEHRGAVTTLVIDASRNRLISGSEDSTLRIWSLPSGELLATLISTDKGEWAVFTPDGFVDASLHGRRFLQYVASTDWYRWQVG